MLASEFFKLGKNMVSIKVISMLVNLASMAVLLNTPTDNIKKWIVMTILFQRKGLIT